MERIMIQHPGKRAYHTVQYIRCPCGTVLQIDARSPAPDLPVTCPSCERPRLVNRPLPSARLAKRRSRQQQPTFPLWPHND